MDTRTEAQSGFDEQFEPPVTPAGVLAGQVAWPLEQAARQVGEMSAGLFSGLGGITTSGELVAAVAATEKLARAVGALQVALAGRVERDSAADDGVAGGSAAGPGEKSLAHQYGCRNAVELLQRLTAEPSRVITQRLRLAQQVLPRQSLTGSPLVPVVPHVSAALAAGALPLETATMITDVIVQSQAVASPGALDIAERELVATASGMEGSLPEHADSMRTYCQIWGTYLDQDADKPVDRAPNSSGGFGSERNETASSPSRGHSCPRRRRYSAGFLIP